MVFLEFQERRVELAATSSLQMAEESQRFGLHCDSALLGAKVYLCPSAVISQSRKECLRGLEIRSPGDRWLSNGFTCLLQIVAIWSFGCSWGPSHRRLVHLHLRARL